MPVEAVATTPTAVARSFAQPEHLGEWDDDLPEPSRLVLIGGLHAASARAVPSVETCGKKRRRYAAGHAYA